MNQKYRIVSTLLAFVFLISVGTLGYKFLGGSDWSYLDGLYMTVITIGTVGYGETHPLTDSARVFTIFLVFSGAGLMAYTLTALGTFVVEGRIQELWGQRRMKDRIRGLRNHYLICGAGNTGMVVIDEFIRRKLPFVVVESDPKVTAVLLERDINMVAGDATLDEILRSAGIEHASGLVTTLPHDADNVFVALTAKEVNASMLVVSTANKTESLNKLKRAGVNYVVSPNLIAGARMASVIMRPAVVDFLDATMAGGDQSLQMEEMPIKGNSFLERKALKDADIRRRSGAIIVSVKHGTSTVINPEPGYVFEAGDIMIVLGTREQITKMADIANGNG